MAGTVPGSSATIASATGWSVASVSGPAAGATNPSVAEVSPSSPGCGQPGASITASSCTTPRSAMGMSSLASSGTVSGIIVGAVSATAVPAASSRIAASLSSTDCSVAAGDSDVSVADVFRSASSVGTPDTVRPSRGRLRRWRGASGSAACDPRPRRIAGFLKVRFPGRPLGLSVSPGGSRRAVPDHREDQAETQQDDDSDVGGHRSSARFVGEAERSMGLARSAASPTYRRIRPKSIAPSARRGGFRIRPSARRGCYDPTRIASGSVAGSVTGAAQVKSRQT